MARASGVESTYALDYAENLGLPSRNSSSFPVLWSKSFPTLVASSTIQHSCQWCKKVFNRKCDLNRHQKRHTRPFKCLDCEKGFASRKDRDRHNNLWVHGQEMNYLCTFSGCISSTMRESGRYAFGRTDRWRTHMLTKHSLSEDELQSIIEKGIPTEKKIAKQTGSNETEEGWNDLLWKARNDRV